MYCPSCDKSYGATHSRCPECHSWLKVSGPKGKRSAKSPSASGSPRQASVKTLEREVPSTTPWTDSSSGSEVAGGWTTPAPQEKPAESGWLNANQEDGWSAGATAPAKSSGWGDEESQRAVSSPKSNSGWLNSEDTEPQAGRGWLGDGPAEEPSMSHMVDQAISLADDEFVDDSWVDEEVTDDKYEDFEVPEYVPPNPEVGGPFLQMLLVAVLVVLIGGGLLFVNTDRKTPEQKAAEAKADKIQSAQAYILDGDKELKAGNAALAVPQFEMALVNLSDVQASQQEIDTLELKLCQAMMKAEDFEKSMEHWKNLTQSPDSQIADAAEVGLGKAKTAKRKEANALLKEARREVNNQGTHSPRGLAEDALEIYQEFGGSNAQIGDAYGVIGLSFINSREFGSAETYLEKALKAEPALKGRYLGHLDKVRLKEIVRPRPRSPIQEPKNPPVFEPGTPDYVSSDHRPRPVPRPRPNPNPNPNPPTDTTQPERMKEIDIHRQPGSRQTERLGEKGTVDSYNGR